jgi:hypothetical protein
VTDPLPRWLVLPGDPPMLKRRLASRQAEDAPDKALPDDWPEDPR